MHNLQSILFIPDTGFLCSTFNWFFLHSNFFLYISLISEPFPAFPPEMTGEFSRHVKTLMVVAFLCRCLCFLLVARHSLQQLICSVKDHLLVEFRVFIMMDIMHMSSAYSIHVYGRLDQIRCLWRLCPLRHHHRYHLYLAIHSMDSIPACKCLFMWNSQWCFVVGIVVKCDDHGIRVDAAPALYHHTYSTSALSWP